MKKSKLTRSQRQGLYGEISKFFVDIAKLVFAGVVLAGILKEGVDTVWLVAGGSTVVLLALYAAYVFYISSKR